MAATKGQIGEQQVNEGLVVENLNNGTLPVKAQASSVSVRRVFNAVVWHGGSVFDAWVNAVSAQVGLAILTLPYTLSQMGYFFGVGSQLLYGAFGCWTVYIVGLFHAEASRRTREIGILHKRHVLQLHEVIAIVAGKTLGRVVLIFNMITLTFGCVLQLIACSSHIYYMDARWNKRQWLYLFGALSLPIVFLPSIHNLRFASIIGVASTTITSVYLTFASVQHGQLQIGPVRHQGPKKLVDFFTGATNILFMFGSHGLSIELMEAMWKPQRYKYVYVGAVLYTYLLTIPDSVAVYWAYGDILLHQSNAFGVLPPSKMKNVSIIAMILHQYVILLLISNPIFLVWEKLVKIHYSSNFALKALARIPIVLVIWFIALAIPFFGPINSVMGAFLMSFTVYIIPCVAYVKAHLNKQLQVLEGEDPYSSKLRLYICIFVASWISIFGFGFGGWASGTMFVKQIQSFGFFEKCYQCPHKNN